MSRKVKHFFGKKETTPLSFDKLRKELYNLTIDNLKDISVENSLHHRLKSLKELNEVILTKKLEKLAVEAICKSVEDLLLDAQNSTETRHFMFQFYTALIMSQDLTDIMRCYLFKLLMMHNNQEDTVPKFEMLKALTDCGKNISCFEEETGPFLLCWLPNIIGSDKTADFFALVTNLIKFNAAYLDDNTISGFLEHACILCTKTNVEEEIEECLNVLEAILCYSHLPDYALQSFIYTLCLTVNVEKFSQCSWKQMRNLLGTNVGHTCIFSLCEILQIKNNYSHAALLRGAVFFIGMALWGSNKVATLIHPPTAVLPSFLKALESRDSIIAYEIILSLQRLVKNGDQLQSLCWEAIFEIIENILSFYELQDGNEASVLSKAVHDLISVAEENAPKSSHERLFQIVEQCASSRNETSVIRLITYSVDLLNPFRSDFISCLQNILDKYFRNEKRSAIQLEALKALRDIRDNSAHVFEEDYFDQIILPYLTLVDTVSDVQVRKAAVEILIDMGSSCLGSLFTEILDVTEKVLKLTFDTLSNLPADNSTTHNQFVDVLVAVQGLIEIFKKKLFFPTNHCLAIYSLLCSHMTKHYSAVSYNNEVSYIRKVILEFFLELRANSRKQLGIFTDGNLEYSVYVSCELMSRDSNGSVPPSPGPTPVPSGTPTISYLSYDSAFQVILSSLKEEKDWTILEMIFQRLPKLLQNKTLIVQGKCNVSALCTTLCRMISDRNIGRPENLKNTPLRLTRTDVQGCIYPCVSALTTYYAHLESFMQRTLIRCLQSGLVSRSAKVCIEGLMLCSLEMQDSMVKLLPDVLLKLSKISSTVGVAVVVLEFLSNLIRLPYLYVSFVEDQYMSIFAIALPYTNPFKFSQYIVALAHHVIAMWFLKCRIPFRKDFAKFISKGLSSNICLPREESGDSQQDESSEASEDKSNKLSKKAILSLHTELMETGLDLMARFTFGMSSNVPKRSPVSEFLLEEGQKTSWLVGNKIVTITTSGCSTKSFKDGLCERCYNLCGEFNKNSDSHDDDSIFIPENEIKREKPTSSFKFERKRHRSAIQRRNTTLSRELMSDSGRTKDDILLHFRRLHSMDSATRGETEVPEDPFSFLKPNKDKEDDQSSHHLCTCWCTNWAEVHIRRPTGNTSWLMKIQNQLCLPSSSPNVPLSLLTSMVLQGPWGQGPDSSLLFPMHEDILEDEPFEIPSSGAMDIISYPKPEPPMRRTNSSPDVNTMWTDSSSTTDTDYLRREHFLLHNSSESEKEFAHSSTECDIPAQSSSRPEEMTSSLKLDLSSESKSALEEKGLKDEEKLAYMKGLSAAPFRDRGHTISVMSPIRPKVSDNSSQKLEPSRRSGMNPSFVFLQMYHDSSFGTPFNKPLLLQQTEANNRALNVLDHIPPYDTHKIGVVYVGEGQASDEVAILSNVYGSTRYVSFLQKLGNFVRLMDVNPQTTYLGGLDTRGEDGKFALIWHDDVMQVVFHVATLMVNKENDPMRNEKKKHIANDCVTIVYNESGEDYQLSTIKGHVTNACVIITPEDFNSNIVSVKLKTKELSKTFDHSESYMISDNNLPVFVRQLALHANLASLIISRQQQSMKYLHVSNWLERLRTIKRLRSKVVDELKNSNDSYESSLDSNNFDNFTEYV